MKASATIAFLLAIAACGPSAHHNDASSVGDGTSDASMFGTPCTTSTDCVGGGYCVDNLGGKVCTYQCSVGCPTHWDCRATKIDGVDVSICVPPDFKVCTSCSADTQCGDGACIPLGGQAFCLPPCPVEGTCPTGYTCGPDPNGQKPGQFCVPMTKSCTCTAGADDGQVRTCTSTNSFGTCNGQETCHPTQGGWGGCTAPAASPEICDGLDNDCNGLVDDGLGGLPCMNTVTGVGSCSGVTLCTGAGGVICQGPTPKVESCNYADDDCDGMIDETFTGLGNVCSAGIGACQRYGVVKCTTDGSGTTCSATAGSPIAELCNGADDDCDGSIDETFTTLGNACSVGVGACRRQGNVVCATGGTTTKCSATAGMATTEACNGIDDDCDGQIDEDFKDAGVYDKDTTCGSCTIDCTVQYAVPNASGKCVVSGSPTCNMVCNPGAFNLDGAVANGCEFILDPGAIYVSVDDPGSVDDAGCGLGPIGTGAGNYPCKSIAQGITRANTLVRPRILVANGTYSESVAIANGRSLLGGYRPDNWVRDVASTDTVIDGFTLVGANARTVSAINIVAATTFEGFVVYGVADPMPGGNSYAIYVSGSNGNLTIKNNVVFGGLGGPGASGTVGADGLAGTNGAGRSSNLAVNDAAYDAKDASGTGECNTSSNRQYTNGGARTCGATSVAGGNGGGNRCAVQSFCDNGDINFGCQQNTTNFHWNEFTAIDGFAGAAGGGALGGTSGTSGVAGDDMIQIFAFFYGGYICYQPTDTDGDGNNTYGRDGGDGGKGGNGSGVAGCSASAGAVVGSDWVGGAAPTGVAGGNGGGGGGGGAGGGGKCEADGFGNTACTDGGGKDTLGAHAGGGGSGGCGGAAGGGAKAGGGAFGIFIVGATAPVVTGNQIFRGEGGGGGAGGAGGKGGTGGTGGLGGTTGVPAKFCTDTAGRGGNGGNGGHASGGGGGCGGSSFGIYTSGVGSPNYCMAGAANTFSGGAGGAGGPGGYSIISPGGAGSAGTLLDCSFN